MEGPLRDLTGTATPVFLLAGIKAFIECLLALAALGQAPLLQKLWICDALSRGGDPRVPYGAFVRCDVLTNMSHTFPWDIIAPPHNARNGFLIRMPANEGSQDLLTTHQGVEDLVEGHAWMTATNGARLPATVMAKYRLPRHHCTTQTRAEWSTSSNISTMLCVNERDAGMRLLDAEMGGLLEDPPANFRIPEGWHGDPTGMGLEKVS